MSGLTKSLRLLCMSRSIRQLSTRSVISSLSKPPVYTRGLFSNQITGSQVGISPKAVLDV